MTQPTEQEIISIAEQLVAMAKYRVDHAKTTLQYQIAMDICLIVVRAIEDMKIRHEREVRAK